MTAGGAFFRLFLDPVQSIYACVASLKMLIHLGFLLFFYQCFKLRMKRNFDLSVLVLASSCIIVDRFSASFTTIMSSPIYTIFYTLGVLLFLLILFPPILNRIVDDYTSKFSFGKSIGLVLASFAVVQCSPVIPPIVLLSVIAYVGMYFIKSGGLIHFFKNHELPFICFLAAICMISIFSFYVGSFNKENFSVQLSIWERYQKLGPGLLQYFTGGPILLPLILLGSAAYYFRKDKSDGDKRLHLFMLIFFISFTILLPLGGFRSYRPMLVRGDTFMIINCFILLLVLRNIYLLYKHQEKNRFIVPIVAILLLSIDLSGIGRNKCEKEALYAIMNAPSNTDVSIDYNCKVLSWDKMTDPYLLDINAAFLEKMKVATKGQRYHFK